MLDQHCRDILSEYDSNFENYDMLRKFICERLNDIVSSQNIIITALESRIKTRDSLVGKLERKGYKYKDLSDITDIIGVRIVTFYNTEVDKIAALIESRFEVDWDNSIDKRTLMGINSFGYLSLHYICRIPESMYYDPDHPEFNKVRFEVQMRTALQHVWATADHDTGYKSNIEVPKEYLRALSRLAGMLEIADQQFSQIIGEINEYRRRVSAIIKDGNFDALELNGDTFKSYLTLKPFEKLNNKISAINNAEIVAQSFDSYLKVFVDMGFKTLGDIERLKAEEFDSAYRLAVLQIGSTDIDILSETIGVQNLCIVHILKNGGGEFGIRKFLDTLYGERQRNVSSAKRIITQAESIHII